MPSREGALERLRVVVEGVAGITFCQRGGDVSRFTADPSVQTYALIVEADDDLTDDSVIGTIDIRMTPTVAVFTRDRTATQNEALYLEILKAVLGDPTLDGNATNIKKGSFAALDFLPQVQGFNIQFLVDIDGIPLF